ncbi:hypothetical protein, partial [Sinorhizobium meliloti]|uniref:hypothetical protein n=1 Tax=Rhizobium meliloti TaxID=382 RepID=UPI001AECA0BF
FSPGHRDLHRIFANPTESQLAEITQFFLRQPLRAQRPTLSANRSLLGHEFKAGIHPKQSGTGDKIGAIDADVEKVVSFRRARSRQDRLRYHLTK